MSHSPEQQAAVWTLTTQELSRRPQEYGLAIDPPGSSEIDDAISVESVGGTDYLVKVHVADAGLIHEEAEVIETARRKGWSRYGETGGVTDLMLPDAIAKNALSLNIDHRGLGAPATTVAFGYDLALQRVSSLDIYKSRVTCEAIEYDELTARYKHHDPQARLLHRIATRLNRFSDIPAEYSRESFSKQIVGEYMLMANRLVAQQAQTHQLPWLFRNHTEAPPIGARDLDASTAEADVLDLLTAMGRASYSITPQRHEGLGLAPYTHFTSPLRRFADLANHLTLHALLSGNSLPYTQTELDDIANELAELSVRSLGNISMRLVRQRGAPAEETATIAT